jgi:hypothetical protein
MKYLSALLIISCFLIKANAQKEENKYWSIAVFNTQNAKPFGKFAGLFGEIIHPGIETGYGKNFSVREKHEWFLELKIACFYHRFVQVGIPVYLNFGYRYKISNQFSVETSLGAGYMHSVPATAKLKMNADGEYSNNKGLGRMQFMAAYSLGVSYIANPSASNPLRIFTAYRQNIQAPFVKSYVPLLPYNSFSLGISRSIK